MRNWQVWNVHRAKPHGQPFKRLSLAVNEAERLGDDYIVVPA